MPFDPMTAVLDESNDFQFDPSTAELDEEQPTFLPGYSRVQDLLARRKRERGQIIDDNTIKAIVNTALNPGFLSLPGLAKEGLRSGGEIFSRGEAAIANPAMSIQEGRTAPQDLKTEITQALTGEKYGQLGDIMRNVGTPEPLASVIGALGMAGLMAPKTTGRGFAKVFTRPAQTAREAGQEILNLGKLSKEGLTQLKSKLPQRMGKNFVIDRNKAAVELLDENRKSLGKSVGEAINKVKDMEVNAQKITEATKNIQLPQNVISALDNPMYGIEKLPDGSFKPTIGNIQKITEALDDFMTSKTWEEATKMGQIQIKRVYGVLKQSMKEAAPSISEPISKYHDFMDNYRLVNKTLRDSMGTVTEKGTIRALRKGGERSLQQAWEEFVKFEPKAQQIMKDIQKFTQRQAVKKSIIRTLPWIGGFELGRRITGKIMGRE